jgi:hypothetical protein
MIRRKQSETIRIVMGWDVNERMIVVIKLLRKPERSKTCDGVDNNCDGQIDED